MSDAHSAHCEKLRRIGKNIMYGSLTKKKDIFGMNARRMIGAIGKH